PRHERPADFRILAAPRSGGVGRADQDRQDRAGQGAAQKGDLLARPVARPARRAGPPGDHQPMIAAVALALALQGGLPDRGAAARYFLDLAARAPGDAGHDAVFPAVVADSVTVWPDLLRLARTAIVARETRRSAVFWLGQAAGEAATRGLTELLDDTTVALDVKESAVFALSQQPRDEGVPALIRVARTHPSPGVRKKALFWLGQSDDPRALALFE